MLLLDYHMSGKLCQVCALALCAIRLGAGKVLLIKRLPCRTFNLCIEIALELPAGSGAITPYPVVCGLSLWVAMLRA